MGGLASTVFAPLAAVLESTGSWRSAYAILAAPLAVTIALHWLGLRAPWTPTLATEPQADRGLRTVRATPCSGTDTSSLLSPR